ncbi:MAG: CinA family nicotinamide mononucleotide deamidase-related protein [Tannerellaceae bacterium]|jgi:nicotinamide-nucleotide amidase|nr:CinA family nicotinamide mononucleotide deamidase-related protein [Tannerellaceae bacterium]
MTAEIITIGDELLIGQVVDTNSSWMAAELEKEGFRTRWITSVGDAEEDLLAAVAGALQRVEVVLTTGGLGPTPDDVTMDALCRFFESDRHFSEAIHAQIQDLFLRSEREMNPLTRRQAVVPDRAKPIPNPAGTAPGLWFERNGKVLVALPGVPEEMKRMMQKEVIPRLRQAFGQDVYVRHRTFWVTGLSESALALKLEGFEAGLPSGVKLAYLPREGLVRLRLSACCPSEEEALGQIAEQQEKLAQLLGRPLPGEDDKPPNLLLGEALLAKKWKMGTAESCTGGALAAAITSAPGSSRYYAGGVVSYANEVKCGVLGVAEALMGRFGAVSREVVEQMALGALRTLNCDCAVATSGIAGPEGGTAEKPVGMVWIAVASRDGRMASRCFRFGSILREVNIARAVNAAFVLLLELVSGKES